jgi:TM2 domain-containing membrane protein YozV
MSLSIEERQLIELRIRNDAPSVVVAYVLWGFLGLLSAHRFYLGRPRSAVLQILSWLTVVGGLVWWLFDAVMISAYIRDEKTALRARMVMEMGDEQRTAIPTVRGRPPDGPVDRAPVQPGTPSPSAIAAAIPAGRPAEPDLVLTTAAEPPLTLGGAPLSRRDTQGLEAAASETKPLAVKPTVKLPMDTTAAHKAQSPAVATLALSEGWPSAVTEPDPAAPGVQKVSIPHPEAVDGSPIEVFPPAPVIEVAEHEPAAAEVPLRFDHGA